MSADFGAHPGGYHTLSTLRELKKKNFDLVAYSNLDRMDELSPHIRSLLSPWHSIEKKNDSKSIRFALGAIKGVGIASMKYLVNERKSNGKYTDIIDFMTRLRSDVINKRQLEKLIQSGAFDSISINRAKLFVNVPNFVEIYSGIKKTDKDQTLLFEENKLSFEDKNLFNQQVTEWSSGKLLKNELEVIGFYFSSHPNSLYPKKYL